MRVASIDIGSNSILLLIAAKDPAGIWRRLEEYTEVARIAEGLDTHGSLQRAAIDRAASVLGRFVGLARDRKVQDILMTGTAPFRRASNGRAVAQYLEERLNVPLMIASGDQEGELTLRATLDSFPAFDAMRVLDIGGASTELICWEHREVQSQSIDVGVVRLLERFVTEDPPSNASLRRMQSYISEELMRHFERPSDGLPIVGVGGTITSLAALDLALERWDPDVVQGHRLKIQSIGKLIDTLWPMSVQQRCDILRVDPRRADVIGVGASFLHAICEHLGAEEIIVSDRGVRWGRVYAWEERQHGR